MLRWIFAAVANLLLLLLLPLRLWRRRSAAGPAGWVHLRIDGPLLDLARPRVHWTELLKSRGEKQELNLHRLGEALEELATDRRARGLLVTLVSAGGGAARLRSLYEHFETLKQRGKRIIVYLPQGASLRELTVAGVADAIWLDPAASIAPLGMAASVPYVKDGLARAGAEADVFAKGRYKTAAENLTRSSMSEAQREQLGALLDDLFDEAVQTLARGRSVDEQRVLSWIEQSPWAARDALDQGIVDALATDQDLFERLVAWPEEPRDEDAQSTPRKLDEASPEPVGIGAYLRRRRVRFVPFRLRDYTAIVDVHGAIVSEARPGGAVARERPIVQAIERARRDRRAKAVVLHVDSRGGSALASSRIARAVDRLRAHKPVVAYFSDVAASGGYMIGAGAHKIVAQPVTITGSIGVVAAKPVIAGLLQRLGVQLETVKRGERVDMFSAARHLQAEERAALGRELDVTYDEFIRVVASGRGRSEEEIRRVAEGRVWSGKAALREGLVDRLGGFAAALDEARALVGRADLEPRPVHGSLWSGGWGGAALLSQAALGADGSWRLLGDAASLAGLAGSGSLGVALREAAVLAEDGCRVAAHCDLTLALAPDR